MVELNFSGAFAEALNSGLTVDEVMHGLVTLPFALFILYKTQSVRLFLVAFLTTYLIDLDHLVDYFAFYGARFSLVEFLELDYFRLSGRAIVPFHAWEWVLLLSIKARQRGVNSVWAALAMGIFSHLIWDSITLGSAAFYFIILRSLGGFSLM